MKTSFRIMAIFLALLCILPTSIFAVKFTEAADDLKEAGLFLGTDRGYELESVPTRAQAAVMLVRFLGKEAEAKAEGGEGLPFTDLPDWTKPYVKYLYDNDLTAGTSDTTYSPDTECTAQMYATFMLRALGYSDKNGDFKYSDAISFARAKDLINDENYDSKSFLRDHMVGISRLALTLPTADGRYPMLAEKLYEEGAVTEKIAGDFIDEAESKKIKVAFVGDSLTWSGLCTNQDENSYPALVSKWLGANYNGVNFGQGGATYMFSTIDYGYEYATNVKAFGKSLAFEPDIVIIMFGTNDAAISGGNNMNILTKDATHIINQYQKLKSDPLVVVCSAPSCPQLGTVINNSVNPALKDMAKRLRLDYIDTFTATTDPRLSPDNVHFTDEGYAILASAIFEQLTDILVKNGYMTKDEAKAKLALQQADLKAIKAGIERLPIKMNDEAELVKLYKEAGLDQKRNSVKYICPDYDCSGGIYAISAKMYKTLDKTGEKNADGWTLLDPQKFCIGDYPMNTWAPNGAFDARAYTKEIKGCYFIWADNTFSFGDPGGGWTCANNKFSWSRGTSDEFEFIVCDATKLSGRKIQFIATDSAKTGYIYTITEDIVSEWNIDETDSEKMYGITWKKVDTYGMKVDIPFYAWAHNADNRGFFREKNLDKLLRDYEVEMYVGEKNGNFYFWMKDAKNFSTNEIHLNFESDTWTLGWESDGKMCQSTFFCITSVARPGAELPNDLVKFN